jgi:hypothetical protein
MRTKNFFRIMFSAAMLFVAYVNADAQLTTTAGATAIETDADEATDFVTIGSRMPYEVTRDATISALVTANPGVFSPSVFRWAVAGAATGALEQQAGGGLTAAPAPDAATHVTQNQVAVHWTGLGAATISVYEKSQNLVSLPACEDATAEDLNVRVVALPTLSFIEKSGVIYDNIMGGCSVDGTGIAIPVSTTGTDLWGMTFHVRHYTLAGAAIPADDVDSTTASLGAKDLFTDGFANLDSFTMYTLNIPAASYGYYDITVTSVTDRISRKSLNTPAQDPGTPTGATLRVWSLPTPVTSPVRHKTNLGW